MSQFKNFKDYVFSNLFPSYYKDNDTYKDDNGEGILERFISICSEYFDTDIIPDIDNYLDIIDVDKTSDIYLNYLWEYFGYIPYAYGVITRGEPYTKENVARWLNNPTSYPKADTRNILKYAISLYKIRCTNDFFTVLGRFYGVRFEFQLADSTGEPINLDDLIVSTYANIRAYYENIIAGYNIGSECNVCIRLKVTIYIPKGVLDIIHKNGNEEDVLNAFVEILNRYMPVNVEVLNGDGDVTIVSDMPTLLVKAPPSIPIQETQGTVRISSQEALVPETNELQIATYSDYYSTYAGVKAGWYKNS